VPGRAHCDTRFWCGFCGKVVPLKAKGPLAWNERYNHIDDHLFGRNGQPDMDISNWKSIDPESPGAAEQSLSSDSDESTHPGSGPPAPATREEGGRTPAPRRRHTGGDDDRGPAKRSMTALQLICCQCNMNRIPETTPVCVNGDCEHPECPSCTREGVRQ